MQARLPISLSISPLEQSHESQPPPSLLSISSHNFFFLSLCLSLSLRCVSTAKAIPKDKAIKRFLVRYAPRCIAIASLSECCFCGASAVSSSSKLDRLASLIVSASSTVAQPGLQSCFGLACPALIVCNFRVCLSDLPRFIFVALRVCSASFLVSLLFKGWCLAALKSLLLAKKPSRLTELPSDMAQQHTAI